MTSFARMLDDVLDKGAAGIRIEADRRPVVWGEDGPRYSDLPILTTPDVDRIIEAITTPADRKALTSSGACDVFYRHGRTMFTCSVLTQYEYSVTFRLSPDALLELSTAEHLSLVDEPAPNASGPPDGEQPTTVPPPGGEERPAPARQEATAPPASPTASISSCRGWSTTARPTST